MGSVSERRYGDCCQDKTKREDVDRGRDTRDTEVVATLSNGSIVLRTTARTINLTRVEGDIWERDRKEVPRVRLAPSNPATKGDESTTRANIEAEASDSAFPFWPQRLHTTEPQLQVDTDICPFTSLSSLMYMSVIMRARNH